MKLFLTRGGPVVEHDGVRRLLPAMWDELVKADDLPQLLRDSMRQAADVSKWDEASLLARHYGRPLL